MPLPGRTPIEWGAVEGESPVRAPALHARYVSHESGCLRVQPKVGGKFHLKLNISKRPIANKYREGKMKRTLKRECKGLEIAKREAAAGSRCGALGRRRCQHQLAVREDGSGEVHRPCASGCPVLETRGPCRAAD